MKKLLMAFFIIGMTACTAFGGTFGIEWGPMTGVDGFRIYTSETSGGPYSQLPEVGNVTSTVTPEMAPGNHCFVITAFVNNGSLESGYSNEMCEGMPFPSLTAPSLIRVFVN